MKIKDGYIVREVAGQVVVLPSGDDLDLNVMITLNSTGKFLWEHLCNDCTEDALVEEVLKVYDVEEATAKVAVSDFVNQLKHYGLLV